MVAKTKTYRGHKIEIKYDENAESPRLDDNICVFHIAHKKYSFGDENYSDFEDIKTAENKAKRCNDLVLPLYMYDHSGITISLSPFSCHWDSGQVGFIQISRVQIISEFGSKVLTPKLKKKAIEIAESEVKILDSYLRGEVYGYIIDVNGDSCWGYYSVEDAIIEAKEVIDFEVLDNK